MDSMVVLALVLRRVRQRVRAQSNFSRDNILKRRGNISDIPEVNNGREIWHSGFREILGIGILERSIHGNIWAPPVSSRLKKNQSKKLRL